MSVFHCPTDCADHDYLFPHSVITTTTTEGSELVTREFITCRICHHWIDNSQRCDCAYACHEEEGGTVVTRTPLSVISCP